MKIALQIFGHLRTFEECAPKLKEFVIDIYQPDIFIHSWDRLDHSTKTWYRDEKNSDKNIEINSEIINKVKELYNPKSILIESQDIIEEQPGYYGTDDYIKISLKGIKSMLYSVHKVNSLRLDYERKTNQSYDLVIMIRPDIMPLAKLNIDDYISELKHNANSSVHLLFDVYSKLCGDKFFIIAGALDVYFLAYPNIISKISNAYLEFDKFFKNYPQDVFPKQISHPELSWHEYIISCGVIPRLYRSYFVIKRFNSKDDIKLCPPSKTNKIFTELNNSYWQIKLKTFIKDLVGKLLLIIKKIIPLTLRKILYNTLIFVIKLLNFVKDRCL